MLCRIFPLAEEFLVPGQGCLLLWWSKVFWHMTLHSLASRKLLIKVASLFIQIPVSQSLSLSRRNCASGWRIQKSHKQNLLSGWSATWKFPVQYQLVINTQSENEAFAEHLLNQNIVTSFKNLLIIMICFQEPSLPPKLCKECAQISFQTSVVSKSVF